MLNMRSGTDVRAQRASLVGDAYGALKEAIRNNTFAPGYQGSEQEIATQLGMSRTPVHEVIIALETASSELLAEKPKNERDPIVKELNDVNAQMQAALAADDLDDWAKGDERFHQLLVERCGNGRFARMFHTIMDQSHRARMLTLRLRPKPTTSVREHQAIIDAIQQGDAVLARERAKHHRTSARDLLLPLLSQLGMKHL